ncbi:MAG: thioredoxin [Alphaproteobacteria bacterium]|nr:thioredoxin [Alphaproteobacteria bacterium]
MNYTIIRKFSMNNRNIASVFLLSFLISLATVFSYSYGQEENRPTLIVFSADWCGACKIAKHDINNDHNLSEVVKKYFVVTANYDVDKDLVEGYNVDRIPTFVVIDKSTVTKKVGYNGPKDLIKFLK